METRTYEIRVNEIIKESIDEKGISLYKLSKLTGIALSTLKNYFIKGFPIRWSKFANICINAKLDMLDLLNKFDDIVKGESLNDDQPRKTNNSLKA